MTPTEEEEAALKQVPPGQGADQEAPFYNMATGDRNDDIAIYMLLLQDANSVLIGQCRTGRIALSLAKAGKNVEAYDGNAAMLGQALQARFALPPNDRNRILFVQEDPLSFQAQEKYDAAMMVEGTYPQILRRSDRLRALAGLRSGLNENGLLILGMDAPSAHRAKSFNVPVVTRHGRLPEGDRTYLRTTTASRLGRFHVRHVTLHAIVSGRAGLEKEEYSETVYRILTLPEVLAEIDEAGFQPTRVLGDLKGNPYKEGSPNIVVVATAKAMAPVAAPVRESLPGIPDV